ncbi:MAG TPA: helix-turn-helix transcriptional regulator [Anaerolineales bacterium]
MKKLGETVRRYRLERGWSIRELAERAGMTHPPIGKIERGLAKAPDPETLNKLEDALNLPKGTLLIEAGYVSPPTRHSRLASLAMHLFDQLPEEYQVRLLKRLQIEFELMQEELSGNK